MTEQATSEAVAADDGQGRVAKAPLGPYTLPILFAVVGLILAAIPLEPELLGNGMSMDYPLWYNVGRLILSGGDLHSLDANSTFAFLYPPFAALLIAPFCLFGRPVMIALLVAVNLASWWAAAALSDRLSGWRGLKPWWLVALPSALSLPFIVETVHLGQPNLALLVLMLAGLALLQRGRQVGAGALFALSAAIKAFPVTVLVYLLWRRRWRAAASMAAGLIILLIVVPTPIRGFDRNARELATWFDGMVLSTSEKGFGQRETQNWGWRNNSIIAVTHRLARPIDAEQDDPGMPPLYVNVLNLDYRQANLVRRRSPL